MGGALKTIIHRLPECTFGLNSILTATCVVTAVTEHRRAEQRISLCAGGQRVVSIRALPSEFAAWFHADCNERLHRNHGSDGPQRLARQRPIPGDLHTGAADAVLDANFVILRTRAEAQQWCGHDIGAL